MSHLDRPDESSASDDLPDGVDPLGVLRQRSGHNAFVLTGAAVVALLALIFTLSWIVYHQLAEESDERGPSRGGQTVETSSTPPELT